MIQDTLAKIEAKLRGAPSVRDEQREELLKLVGTLKAEVADLSKTQHEQAQSIAGFTELSAHEATKAKKDPELLRHSLGGLSASVLKLEKTHPQLVEIVNRICVALSNLGI